MNNARWRIKHKEYYLCKFKTLIHVYRNIYVWKSYLKNLLQNACQHDGSDWLGSEGPLEEGPCRWWEGGSKSGWIRRDLAVSEMFYFFKKDVLQRWQRRTTINSEGWQRQNFGDIIYFMHFSCCLKQNAYKMKINADRDRKIA